MDMSKMGVKLLVTVSRQPSHSGGEEKLVLRRYSVTAQRLTRMILVTHNFGSYWLILDSPQHQIRKSLQIKCTNSATAMSGGGGV